MARFCLGAPASCVSGVGRLPVCDSRDLNPNSVRPSDSMPLCLLFCPVSHLPPLPAKKTQQQTTHTGLTCWQRCWMGRCMAA